MKRRELKFVAGSLPLAPDRIEQAPARESAPAIRKRLTTMRTRPPVTRGGKRRSR